MTVFAILWIVVGCACLVGFAFLGLDASALILAGFGLVVLLTGVAQLLDWQVRMVLVRITGAILALYCLALIFMGTEDAGGPWVSLPSGLAGIALGSWSLLLPGRPKADAA